MDNEAHQPNISQAAKSCLDLFKRYLAARGALDRIVAEDLHTRLRLWAAYTGAFASPGAALDDRLIFHEDVKQMVIKLLSMIERNLRNAIKGDGRLDRDRDTLMLESDVSGSLAPADLPYASLRGLNAVSAALDRLHRLATAIRRSSIESQRDKLSTKTSHFDSDGYFQECIDRLLQDRFPNARASLIDQLTSALCFYRQRLLYRPRHNRKLALKQGDERKLDPRRTTQSLQLVLAHKNIESNLSDHRLVSDGAPTVPLSRTEASIPDSQLRRAVLRASMPVPSVVSIGSSVYGDHFQYPDPPKIDQNAKLHPCPYCAEPLPTARLRHEKLDFWRAHIMRDLEPYVCISEACRDPLQFFVHFQDWVDHMNTMHTSEWYRVVHARTWYCDLNHPQRNFFDSKSNFDMHMRESHPGLTTSQLIARTKKSKAIEPRPQLTCPLCETIPEKLRAVSMQVRLEDTQSLLAKHVSSHIKALSLLSFRFVPLNGVGQQAIHESDTDLSRIERGRRSNAGNLTQSSNIATDVSFPRRLTPSQHVRSQRFHQDSESSGLFDEENIEVPDCDQFVWDQVSGFEHLRHAERIPLQKQSGRSGSDTSMNLRPASNIPEPARVQFHLSEPKMMPGSPDAIYLDHFSLGGNETLAPNVIEGSISSLDTGDDFRPTVPVEIEVLQDEDSDRSVLSPPPEARSIIPESDISSMPAESSLAPSPPINMSPASQSVSITRGMSSRRPPLLPPIPQYLKGRKCLVLDLDETLIHSSFKILNQADFTIPVERDGWYHNVYVIKRPGVDSFLKRMAQLYEVVIFSEKDSKYCDPLIDQLDIHHSVHHRLYRESCRREYILGEIKDQVEDEHASYIKDLTMLGRDLRSIIILDNSPTSYLLHPQHALPISSWFSDAHDVELLDLIPVLEDLAGDNVTDTSLVLDVGID